METEAWLQAEIQRLEAANPTAPLTTQALLAATQQVAQEQALRIEQAEAELDGRIWSPNKW
ncbi:hypothetical protein M3M39_00320 [Fructilactobacillus hinvesii]|uniref:Uncharacterized protein n=1 Tax=Fructilactobacillus hinvesii TaxID=2940300 RepID=A0ABY5BS80_9LACO|nr:hypothetical protein [Fructilactobacillus hinvesii]USS87969.1 hypothetical protein M3M39_00320 [Fructilactobacillus hinvesii]